jgi:hypothetical protein
MRHGIAIPNQKKNQQACDREPPLRPNRGHSSHKHRRKVMLSVFFDSVAPLLPHFKSRNHTICANSQTPQNLHAKIKKRRPCKSTDIVILLHDNVHHHVVPGVKDQLNAMRWEVLLHPEYSQDFRHAIFTSQRKPSKAVRSRRMTMYKRLKNRGSGSSPRNSL